MAYSLLSRPVAAFLIALAAAAGAGAAEIVGEISFPSRNVPPMTAYACETDTSKIHAIGIARDQRQFSVEVPPGRYVVFLAPSSPGAPDVYGAYTEYSLCARHPANEDAPPDAACRDHGLVTFSLGAKSARTAILVDDWYLSDEVAAQLDRIRGIEASVAAEPLSAPRFSEYKAAAYEAAGAPKIDPATALPPEDRARLQAALAGRPNFAGYLSAVATHCAAACDRWVLIDWRSGALIEPPALREVEGPLPCRGDEAVLTRSDSRLLTVTRRRDDAIVTQYYLWKQDGAALALIAEIPRNAQQYCAVMPP